MVTERSELLELADGVALGDDVVVVRGPRRGVTGTVYGMRHGGRRVLIETPDHERGGSKWIEVRRRRIRPAEM